MEPSSREKILEVAEARFAKRGFAGVGMREVAQAAGLGKSSLFHHFPSKAVLYGAVLERVIGRIEAHLLPALSREGRAEQRLDAAVDALVDSLSEHPSTARLLLRTLFEDEQLAEPSSFAVVEARVHALVGAFVSLLSAGAEAGELRAGAPAHAVQALIGAAVYHFASGEFGDAVLGRPVFSADAVAAYRRELKQLLRSGLVGPRAPSKENAPS
ncbi:MAG: TetR/AcrR family transcriptional regulator [Myxococcota bacterium]